MNLVGKILVVLVFVFSLVFMAFAIAVYSTHKNWRDVVLRKPEEAKSPQEVGLKYQLDQERARYKDLEAQKQRLETELNNEKSSAARTVALLQTEMLEVKQRRDLLEKNEAQLKQKTDEAVAAQIATHNTLEKLREEVSTLRTDVEDARNKRQEAFEESVKLADELAQATGELNLIKRRNEELVRDNAKFSLAFQDAQIQLDRGGPPRLDGVVLAVLNDHVEISLGSDDGLEKRHELDVYRVGPSAVESKYLGRVRVVQTFPDRSVAQILPGFKKGTVQKEDRVATGLPTIRPSALSQSR